MPHPKPQIAFINGSLGGAAGNTATVVQALENYFHQRSISVVTIHLTNVTNPSSACEQIPSDVINAISASDAFVFATGTYWDSWGSPLQRFFEQMTDHEASDLWLGKPAASIVTMHSVGGKEVLSRLQGVLTTLGCLIPPMSGMAYSLANHLVLQAPNSEFAADLWQLEDIEIIGHNLVEAVRGGRDWKAWPVDHGDPRRKWLSPK